VRKSASDPRLSLPQRRLNDGISRAAIASGRSRNSLYIQYPRGVIGAESREQPTLGLPAATD
jgi:hypothetical protein